MGAVGRASVTREHTLDNMGGVLPGLWQGWSGRGTGG